MLEVHEINTYYGRSHILFNLSLNVEIGEIVCLLGRNGSGKTTTLRSIMRLTPTQSGSIKLEGMEISKRPAFQIWRMGVGYVPEHRGIFPGLTVHENLWITHRPTRGGSGRTIKETYDLFPTLKQLDRRQGDRLSGGQQQMLAIARSLGGNPKLLLLDEPSTGLSPLVLRDLGEKIEGFRERKIAILLAEQNVKFAMDIGHRVYILNKGEISYEGTTAELQHRKDLMKKYLGV